MWLNFQEEEMDVRDVRPGWDVFGSDDKKIGDVAEMGSNYLLVTKGLIFKKDLYIPFDAVSRVDQDRVYLNVPSDRIDSMNWYAPPVAPITAPTMAATEATMPESGMTTGGPSMGEGMMESTRIPMTYDETQAFSQSFPSEEAYGNYLAQWIENNVPLHTDAVAMAVFAVAREEYGVPAEEVIQETEVFGTMEAPPGEMPTEEHPTENP